MTDGEKAGRRKFPRAGGRAGGHRQLLSGAPRASRPGFWAPRCPPGTGPQRGRMARAAWKDSPVGARQSWLGSVGHQPAE